MDTTELFYGDRAIRTMAKIMVFEGSSYGREPLPGNVIAGGLFTHIIEAKDKPKDNLCTDQLWVAEIILIPRFIFNSPTVEPGWPGMGIDQRLCSNWGNVKNWKLIYKQEQP